VTLLLSLHPAESAASIATLPVLSLCVSVLPPLSPKAARLMLPDVVLLLPLETEHPLGR
jgi:hypothetical protein